MPLQLKKYIEEMSNSTQFCTIKYEEFEEVLSVIIEANRNTFPLIVNKCQSIEEFQFQSRVILQTCLQEDTENGRPYRMKFNYGIRVNGRLVAVLLSMDLRQMYDKIKPIINQQDLPGHHFCSQFDHFNLESLKPGTATYFSRMSVLPEYMGKGVGIRLVYEAFKYQADHGYQFSIVATMVDASFKLISKLGAYTIRQTEQHFPNFIFKTKYLRVDFKKAINIYENQGISPKL